MPMNVIHVKTGLMLNDIQSVGGVDLKVTCILLNLLVNWLIVRFGIRSFTPYFL